jgi:hypothetical protein
MVAPPFAVGMIRVMKKNCPAKSIMLSGSIMLESG